MDRNLDPSRSSETMQETSPDKLFYCILSAILYLCHIQDVFVNGELEISENSCDSALCESTRPRVIASTNFISPKSENELSGDEKIDFTYPSSPYIVISAAMTIEIHGFNIRSR